MQELVPKSAPMLLSYFSVLRPSNQPACYYSLVRREAQRGWGRDPGCWGVFLWTISRSALRARDHWHFRKVLATRGVAFIFLASTAGNHPNRVPDGAMASNYPLRLDKGIAAVIGPFLLQRCFPDQRTG